MEGMMTRRKAAEQGLNIDDICMQNQQVLRDLENRRQAFRRVGLESLEVHAVPNNHQQNDPFSPVVNLNDDQGRIVESDLTEMTSLDSIELQRQRNLGGKSQGLGQNNVNLNRNMQVGQQSVMNSRQMLPQVAVNVPVNQNGGNYFTGYQQMFYGVPPGCFPVNQVQGGGTHRQNQFVPPQMTLGGYQPQHQQFWCHPQQLMAPPGFNAHQPVVGNSCDMFLSSTLWGNVPDLRGSEGCDRIREFFKKFDLATSEWSNKKRIEALGAKISGRIERAYNAALSTEPFHYEHIKRAMLAQLEDTDVKGVGSFESLMRGVKRGQNESIDDLGDRILSLVRKAYSGLTQHLIDEYAIKHFILNLGDQDLALHLELARRPGVTFDQFMSLAARAESTQLGVKRRLATNIESKPRNFFQTQSRMAIVGSLKAKKVENFFQSIDPIERKIVKEGSAGNMIVIQVLTVGKEGKALLDPGAQVSLVSSEFVYNLATEMKLNLSDEEFAFTKSAHDVFDVNGTKIESYGLIRLPIMRFGSDSTFVWLHITNAPFGYDFLLGTNALNNLGFQLYDKSNNKFIEFKASQNPSDGAARVNFATIQPRAAQFVEMENQAHILPSWSPKVARNNRARKCYKCKEFGHFLAECPQIVRIFQLRTIEKQEEGDVECVSDGAKYGQEGKCPGKEKSWNWTRHWQKKGRKKMPVNGFDKKKQSWVDLRLENGRKHCEVVVRRDFCVNETGRHGSDSGANLCDSPDVETDVSSSNRWRFRSISSPSAHSRLSPSPNSRLKSAPAPLSRLYPLSVVPNRRCGLCDPRRSSSDASVGSIGLCDLTRHHSSVGSTGLCDLTRHHPCLPGSSTSRQPCSLLRRPRTCIVPASPNKACLGTTR